jgi:hypothetical protein
MDTRWLDADPFHQCMHGADTTRWEFHATQVARVSTWSGDHCGGFVCRSLRLRSKRFPIHRSVSLSWGSAPARGPTRAGRSASTRRPTSAGEPAPARGATRAGRSASTRRSASAGEPAPAGESSVGIRRKLVWRLERFSRGPLDDNVQHRRHLHRLQPERAID